MDTFRVITSCDFILKLNRIRNDVYFYQHDEKSFTTNIYICSERMAYVYIYIYNIL